MFEPPNPFPNDRPFSDNLGNSNSVFSKNSSDGIEFGTVPIGKNPSTPILKRLFVICLTVGLVVGSICAFGVVKLIKYWGLNDVPQPSTEVDR